MKKKLPKSSSSRVTAASLVQRNKQFPNILRFITEYSLPQASLHVVKIFAVSFVSGLLLFGIGLQVVSLQQNMAEEKKITAAREQVLSEINYWKKVADTHKDYRDVYYRIATLSYKVGKIDEAKKYIQKALDLDPNFKEGRVLGAKIGV